MGENMDVTYIYVTPYVHTSRASSATVLYMYVRE